MCDRHNARPVGQVEVVRVVNRAAAAAFDGDFFERERDVPVLVPYGERLMLVEVDRDGRPAASVPFPDLVRPRRATWAVDRYALPVTYFRRILRGKV